MHCERVRSDLQQVEKTISMASRPDIGSETEKRTSEEVLNLVRQATERHLLARTGSTRETFS